MARWSKFLLLLFFMFWGICFGSAKAAAEPVLLKIGAQGNLVRTVQNYLRHLNYFKRNPTGYYGAMTKEAVKSFQLEHGMVGNGETDMDTYTAIQHAYTQKNSFTQYTVLPGESLMDVSVKFNTSIAALMVQNKLPNNEVSAGKTLIIPVAGNGTRGANSRSRIGMIQVVPWSIVDQLWKKDENARLVDVDTGKSLQIKRLYGYYHADVEPLTKYDTQILKEIYGGSWSWSRRAVIIQVHNLYLAASINGMPHGGRSIYNNNFPGQFCAHFLGSRIHNNNRVDPEHQAMIDKAANATPPSGTIQIPESLKGKIESVIL